jgi:acyl carrier protein
MDVRDRVRGFITTELAQKEGAVGTVSDSESLLDRGILDSLGVLRVLGFLEEEYRLTVGDDDVVPENFESIDAIVAFVQRRRANGG